MTAYAAVYGEEYRRDNFPSGETVRVKIVVPAHRGIRPGGRAHKGDTTLVRAIWLRRSEITDEHLAGTVDGLGQEQNDSQTSRGQHSRPHFA